MIVYLCTQGSYDEYEVMAILTDAQEAVRLCDEQGWNCQPRELDAVKSVQKVPRQKLKGFEELRAPVGIQMGWIKEDVS